MGPEQEARVRLLSDGSLQEKAAAFAQEVVQFAPKDEDLRPAQLHGLLQFARGEWAELQCFVQRQAARKWEERRSGEAHPSKKFYDALSKKLAELQQQKQLEEWGLVAAGLSKKEFQEQAPAVAIRLAREFLQHLVADILYRRFAPGGSHAVASASE